ncbi:deoxyribose-phosphate aldolase [Rhizobiales bacterium GAS191]|nr:deoxyribose-phosphate aldolase [Rhizobiales bacterium GAS188]SED24528.1 deoxyribose-phosphate aldolase [Rhizobiales bacterium GAS191]
MPEPAPEFGNIRDAERALACLDLTDLGEAATEDDALRLCAAAVAPRRVAAVCLWPRFVAAARRRLAGSGVKVATVANFPSGEERPGKVRGAILAMLDDGADEIDMVIPYRRLIAGRPRTVTTLLRMARATIGARATFKVILETGEYPNEGLIADAARRAIGEGADFLKTSTGKSKLSATPQAARLLLEAARAAARPVGVKISGGVRSLADASTYLALADEIMGPAWVKPSHFRFGASSLRDALLARLGNGTQGLGARDEAGARRHAY